MVCQAAVQVEVVELDQRDIYRSLANQRRMLFESQSSSQAPAPSKSAELPGPSSALQAKPQGSSIRPTEKQAEGPDEAAGKARRSSSGKGEQEEERQEEYALLPELETSYRAPQPL
jgi:hypothetical protein